MNKRMLMTGLLVFGLVAYGALLTVAGAALRQPVKDMVLAVRTQPQESAVTFPVAIDNTPLIALNPVCYDGPFSEAEGAVPIANGLALLLENASDQELLWAKVTLEKQGQQFFFDATHIPPRARILVVETDSAQWQEEPFDLCTGSAEYATAQSLPETVLQIAEADMGAVNLTNISDQPLGEFRLYYKNYLPEQDLYLGGRTFTKTVEGLLPGQTLYVPLEFYASGSSRILKAESTQ